MKDGITSVRRNDLEGEVYRSLNNFALTNSEKRKYCNKIIQELTNNTILNEKGGSYQINKKVNQSTITGILKSMETKKDIFNDPSIRNYLKGKQ